MKKVYIICMAILFCAAAASADPVEEGLPKTATPQIKNSTRQMVNQNVNPENVIDMTRQMLANNFSQQQVLQAHAILMNAHQQGLHTEPIMSKAQEGMAKHIQAKAVIRAMEQVQSRQAFALKQAKSITKDKAKANHMAAILASSMAAGMNHEDTGRIMQALQGRIQNMTRTRAENLALQTFMTTRTMSRLGMQSKSVGNSICQALQQGFSAQEMHNMQNTIMEKSTHSFSKIFSKSHSSNAGQHDDQEGMRGHGGDSGGGMGGSPGGGMGGDSGGGMGGGSGGGMGGGSDGGHM
jgi:hypothetical protein